MNKHNAFGVSSITGVLIWLILLQVAQADKQAEAFNRVNFSVTASRQVEQDLLVTTLSTQHQDAKSSVAADKVNQTMQWALNQSAKIDEVKTRTLGYSTRPIYNKQKVRSWNVMQSFRVESKNHTNMTALLAVLQEKLDISSMSYQLSKARRTTIETELINVAINDFVQRAEQVQQQLGRSRYRIVQLDLNTNRSNGSVPYQRAAMMSEAASYSKVSTPVVKAGEAEISVIASGTIELLED